MEIQIALDRIPLERSVALARDVAPHADWVEVGTSLVKQFGQAGIEAVVAAAGDTPVLADLKTADDVRFEFEMAFAAGARAATVLGLAPRVTVERAVDVCEEHRRELVVDLMGLAERQIADLAGWLPASAVLGAHVSKDAQGSGQRAADLLGPWADGRRLALAGGLGAHDLPALRSWPDLRVIVGSAVTQAADPVQAALELRRATREEEPTHG